MKTYIICRYHDARELGTIDMTPDEFAAYIEMAQEPEGLVPLSALLADRIRLREPADGSRTVYLI